MWDVETGACTVKVREPRNMVTCLKYLASESSSAVVQGGEDLRLRVWDSRQGGLTPVLTIKGYVYFPVCVP